MKKEPATMKKIPALLLIPVLIWFDQWTKHLAAVKLANGPFVLIPGVLELRYLQNSGAAWGMFQNGIPFFLILTVIVLAGICYVYWKLPPVRHYIPLQILMLFLASGAIGNMIDRVLRGYVIDFIYISLIDFPIFNAADMFVSFSVFILALYLIFFYREESDFDFLHIRHKGEEKHGE